MNGDNPHPTPAAGAVSEPDQSDGDRDRQPLNAPAAGAATSGACCGYTNCGCCKYNRRHDRWRCRAGKCCRRCWKKACTAQLTAVILVILGAACIVLAVQAPPYFTGQANRYLYDSTLLASADSPTYAHWVVNTGTVKYYVWEVVNWYEVVHRTAWPAMTQHGPYYYNRTTKYLNVTFWDNAELTDFAGCPDLAGLSDAQLQNLHDKHTEAKLRRSYDAGSDSGSTPAPPPLATTVTFTPTTSYEFMPAVSGTPTQDGGDESEKLTVANLAYWTMISNIQRAPANLIPALLVVLAGIVKTKPEIIFDSHSVNEILFGYNDQSIVLFNEMCVSRSIPFSISPWFYLVQNDTSDDSAFTERRFSCIQTGTVPDEPLQWYSIIDGVSEWDGIWVNRELSRGHMGGQAKLRVGHDPIYIWSNITLRMLQWTFTGETDTYNGLAVNRYEIVQTELLNNASLASNAMYYQNGPFGVFNLSNVPPQFSPIFLSYPHFWQASEVYLEKLQGIDPPDPTLHSNYILVEPYTGTTYVKVERFQWNVRIQGFKDSPVSWVPLAWYEDVWQIGPDVPNLLNSGYFHKTVLADWSTYGGWILAALFYFVAFILMYGIFYRYRRQQALKAKLMSGISVFGATGGGALNAGSPKAGGGGGGGGAYNLMSDEHSGGDSTSASVSSSKRKQRAAQHQHRKQQKQVIAAANGGGSDTASEAGSRVSSNRAHAISGLSNVSLGAGDANISPVLAAAPAPAGAASTASAAAAAAAAPKYRLIRRDDSGAKLLANHPTGDEADDTERTVAAASIGNSTGRLLPAATAVTTTTSTAAAHVSLDLNPNAL